MRSRRPVLATLAAVLAASLLPAGSAVATPESPEVLEAPEAAAPAVVAAPADGTVAAAPVTGVLISEVASGGPSGGSDNFIEIANFGEADVDVSGWRVFRCGQAGDAYGPQAVAPAGIVLAPGERWTAVREGSALAAAGVGDATYGTSLHSFGFGAYLETAEFDVVDRVGFYHPSVDTECANPVALQNVASWAHGESHQRVALTGDITRDWAVAPRTPAQPNAAQGQDLTVVSDVVITEFAPGGPGGYNDDFIEIANLGTGAVDVSDWKVWRCGDNAQSYVQSAGLPAGTVLDPGEVFTLVRSGTSSTVPAAERDLTYGTSVHWINSGAMLLTPDLRIADRFAMYRDRMSPCTDGEALPMDLDVLAGESYQRTSVGGTSASDFTPGLRTPGTDPTAEAVVAVDRDVSPHRGAVEVSELVAAGPAGGSDDFVELVNRSDAPVDTTGWSLLRCEGDGRLSPGAQVADLGRVLEPGGVYLAAAQGAPASLRELADATYATSMNETDGYGALVLDAQGRVVDGVAVWDTIAFTPCAFGYSIQNTTRNDLGESHQRARSTGVNGDDFVKAPRTPGVDEPPVWEDPTVPRPGQLDPVTVPATQVPGTPVTTTTAPDGETGATTSVTPAHAGPEALALDLRAATPIGIDDVVVHTGTTPLAPPASREIDGEVRAAVADLPDLTTQGGAGELAFQRYTIPSTALPADGGELTWSGTAAPRNELQMYAWDPAAGAWALLSAGQPSADGDLTLVGALAPALAADGGIDVLVIDGPRTSGGLIDEVGVTDGAFADPGSYDVAINHMTDTQFLAEDFRRVFTDMAAWVVANADGRKIGYNAHTGDIVENWIGGNTDVERGRREFAAARDIMALINDADIPNGVLPGNHDNLWGRNNDLYNEYFPTEMYSDKPWWGEAWSEGDNSAHYDLFEHEGTDFLVLHLPYRPSGAQLAWASDVAASHPQHNVVLATHSYLNTDGTRDDRDRRYTARGIELWETVVAPNDNVFLVLGGHYHGVSTQYADPVTGEQTDATEVAEGTVVVDNVGESGRRVVEMLADYQGYRSTQPSPRADTLDRDTGFQRLLQLDLDAELMAVNAYSPTLDSFDAWAYDEPGFRGDDARYDAGDDEFVVELSLLRSSEVATASVGLSGPSASVATARLAAGETLNHPWPAQAAGQVWYAAIEPVVDEGEASRGDATRRVVTAPAVLERPAAPEPSFTDVAADDQFFAQIEWLAERGISTGWDNGGGTASFRPLEPIARDAMAAFLHRLAGSPEVELPASSPFSDVAPDDQFYDEIVWLSQRQISTGWDNGDGTASFRPLDPIGRDAMAAFLHRLAGSPEHEGPGASPFTDLTPQTQFYDEITWLASTGIATGWQGNDGTAIYRPISPVARDAMAAFLFRYVEAGLPTGE
ncbi:lamin tail domain-containing protein [Litorihabitans aurantiacus]|uniref:Uncharacterized protein n=1 Tax=Litorihabitans aurantiacus TaxID=1930061 RepID=A0AA38CTP0_9MICO|nr:lamin tail domain-containing protein [Litorihabitans aurantiacus]GMA31540.1 hypothetical protein GCM10025875_15320 [Litorihabitans aurantiacus]